MATPEDLRSEAEYVRLADGYVEIPGGKNENNFANVVLIVETAAACGVDAVWPGWGHASENPALPEALKAKGIVWIGPSPEAMMALGDKIGSTLIAQSVGMSVLPWSGSGLMTGKNICFFFIFFLFKLVFLFYICFFVNKSF